MVDLPKYFFAMETAHKTTFINEKVDYRFSRFDLFTQSNHDIDVVLLA